MSRLLVLSPLILLLALSVTSAVADEATNAQTVQARNPVRLETIISLATGPANETAEQARARAGKFDREIDRLLQVLSDSGGQELKPPVRMTGLSAVQPGVTVTGGFVHTTDKEAVKSVRNSIVVVEPEGVIDSVENSIVIFTGYGDIKHVQDSIVLARYEINVKDARHSVILSGFDANLITTATDCVCGAREMLWIYYPHQFHNLLCVNSKLKGPAFAPRNDSRIVQLEELDLTPAGDHSLDKVVTVTAGAAREGFALFRTSDGKGEYVAHRGLPILGPDGKPVAAVAGWQLESVLDSYVVFVHQDRRAALQVILPEAPANPALTKLLPLPAEERQAAEQVPAEVLQRIRRHLPELNANDSRQRADAEDALVDIGKPALQPLRNLVAGTLSPEVRLRAERALRKIERNVNLADVREHPVRLETLLLLATGAADESPELAQRRTARFDHELDRLLDLLSQESGKDLRPPVRMTGLPAGEVAETVNSRFVHVKPKQSVKSAKNSIVVIEPGSSLRSAENCIVIVASEAGIGFVKDSIVLARYDVNLSAENSVVLSGLDLFFVDAWRCVCGAKREVSTELGIKDSLILNTPKRFTLSTDNSRAVQVNELELAPTLDKSFNDRVAVTYAVHYPRQVALVRTQDGKGEYVARYGQPVLDPDGHPVAALDGWQLEHTSGSGYTVFVKDGLYAELRVINRR